MPTFDTNYGSSISLLDKEMQKTEAAISRDKFISLNALQFYRNTKHNLYKRESIISDDLLSSDRLKVGKVNMIEKLIGPCKESKELINSYRDMIKVLP